MPFKQIEVTVQYTGDPNRDAPFIRDSQKAVEVAREICNHNTMLWLEEAFILCLSNSNRLNGWYRLALGCTRSVHIDPRVVATIALQTAASGIILIHNHPGGDPTPSYQDIYATTDVKKALKTLDIHLIDHIILTDTTHFSMKEHGHL